MTGRTIIDLVEEIGSLIVDDEYTYVYFKTRDGRIIRSKYGGDDEVFYSFKNRFIDCFIKEDELVEVLVDPKFVPKWEPIAINISIQW